MPPAGAIQAGAAFVAISADDSPLIKGLRGASSKVGRFAARLGRIGTGVAKVFRRFGGAIASIGKRMLIAGAAAAAAGALIVRAFAASLDRLAKTADSIGINITALNELQFAADRSGVGIESFNASIQRFVRRAAEAANGTGEAKKVLEQLGIAVKDTNGQVKSAESLFGEVADAVKNTTNAAERVRIAFALFGREGINLVNVLRLGKKGVEELRKEQQRLNPVTEEQARLAEKITDLFTNLKSALTGVRNAFVTALGPVITKILEDMTNAVVDFGVP